MRDRHDTRVRAGLVSGFRGRGDVPKLAAVRWPVGWRCAAIVFLIAVLAALAYETGKSADVQPTFDKPIQYVVETLTKPAVAIPLASLVVIALASLLRRLRFEWLVYKPGPIFVRDFTVAPGVGDIDIAQLATLFRGRLMQLRLHAPTPVPGATPAADFLSVLDAEHLDAKNMLGSIVGILRAAIPTHGYEVSVTLTKQDAAEPEKPRLGVTTQLTRLPNEGVPIDTAWADSWEEAIVQAGDMVTAAVLPRTRLSNGPPWSGWRRYQMPGMAVHGYERAQELTSARRYDEALAHCFQALELDPKSVDLRLCKGFIEEKLGLYMDAVATYAAARHVADETAHRLYNRRARRHRTASGRIATYRLAVLLSGQNFAHQWRKPAGATRRARQRAFLRERLKPELQSLLEGHRLLDAATDKGKGIMAVLDDPVTPDLDEEADPRYYQLRLTLAELAAKELDALRRSLTWRRTQPGSLTPLSVKLTAAAVCLRREYLGRRLGEVGPEPSSVTPSCEWQPTPQVVLGLRRRSLRTWTEEYSAASLCALPLLVKPQRSPDGQREEEKQTQANSADGKEAWRARLADAAVDHLRLAMSATPSVHAAERRDWVLSEDPDLDGLRSCLRFKHFEAVFFPSPAPTPRRPRRASRWEISAYTNALLADAARRWEMVWHQRRALVVARIDPHVVIQWSKDEAGAWEMVARMARDYKHWPARCELIEEMRAWSARYGFGPLEVALPRFVRDNGHDGDEDYLTLCKAVKDEVKTNEDRLEAIFGRLKPITGCGLVADAATSPPQEDVDPRPGHNGYLAAGVLVDTQHRPSRMWTRVTAPLRPGEPPVRQFERLQSELSDRDFWHRAPPHQFLQSVCDVHAAMWQRLHEWLEEPNGRAAEAEADFTCAIAQAARLCETSGVRWVGAVVSRRIQRLGAADMAGAGQPTNGVPARSS